MVRYQILSLCLSPPTLPSHPFSLCPSSFLFSSLSPLLSSFPLIRGGGRQEHPLRHNPFTVSPLRGLIISWIQLLISAYDFYFLSLVLSFRLTSKVFRTHSHWCSCSLSSRKLHQYLPPLRHGAYSFTPSEYGEGGLWLLWLTEYKEYDAAELWRLGFKSPCSFHLGLLEH